MLQNRLQEKFWGFVDDMSLGVSYMGTKRHLAPKLASIVSDSKRGPFLDLFSGMCSVGQIVAPSRQVWSNDLQIFAHQVAHAQFCSVDAPPNSEAAASLALASYLENMSQCQLAHSDKWALDIKASDEADVGLAARLFDDCIERAQALPPSENQPTAYTLFIDRFGGTYFGIRQAAEIDSIRFAIDTLQRDGKISKDQHRWLLLALCVAMSKCANTTGHFAQALYPKTSNRKKVQGQRRRKVWLEWIEAVRSLGPSGSKSWRQNNFAFRSDALELLDDLADSRRKPSVIYADPPYTDDQYSRFYHLYETAILYDFPTCTGRGLYRGNRATSQFSHSTKIEKAMERLIIGTARLKCDLILSYPRNGLLTSSEDKITRMIKKHFRKEPQKFEIDHRHSTMGASKGATQHDVIEMVYKVGAR